MSAQRADARSVGRLGADRLRRVLDDAQAIAPRDREQRLHVGGLAVQMHGHERADPPAGGAMHEPGARPPGSARR